MATIFFSFQCNETFTGSSGTVTCKKKYTKENIYTLTWTWHDARRRPKIRVSFSLSARHRQVHIAECISELKCLRWFLLSISIHFNTLEKVICHYNAVIYLNLFFDIIWPLVWDLIFHSSSSLLRNFSLGLFKRKTVKLHVMLNWVGGSFLRYSVITIQSKQILHINLFHLVIEIFNWKYRMSFH